MKLLTKEILSKLPPLYANENKKPKDVPIIVKFFHPMSNWKWYVIEGEKQKNGDYLFFGYVKGYEGELGYFTLSELESIKLSSKSYNLPIERDMYFDNKTLADVMGE